MLEVEVLRKNPNNPAGNKNDRSLGGVEVGRYMCTYVYALYSVLFFWYLLRCRKANPMLFIDNKDSVFCIL